MIKKSITTLVSMAAAALVFVAHTGVSPNSWFILYEPDVPESLKHKS